MKRERTGRMGGEGCKENVCDGHLLPHYVARARPRVLRRMGDARSEAEKPPLAATSKTVVARGQKKYLLRVPVSTKGGGENSPIIIH